MTTPPTQRTGYNYNRLNAYGDTKRTTRIFHWFIAVILLSLMAGIIILLSTNNILSATFLIGCVAWLVFGELSGAYTPTVLVKSVPGDFFSASLAILVTAFMSRLLTETLFQGSRQLQKELRERKIAEAKYRNIFDNAIDGIFQSTPDGRFINVNPAIARIYGYNFPKEMIESITDISSQLYVDSELRDSFRSRLANGEKITGFESHEYRKDGSTLWTSMNAQAIRDANGNILYYEGAVEDITERKRSHEQIRLVAELSDISPATITVHDLEGNFLYANQRTFDLHGYTKEELLGIKLNELDVPESAELINEHMQKVLETGEASFQVEHFKKDRTILPLEVFVKAMKWDGKEVLLSVGTDITKRKQAEIEREQLIHELAVRNAESETLRESFATIVGTFEFSQIVQHILDQVKRVIPYDSASVWKRDGSLLKFIGGRNLPPIEWTIY